MPDTVHIVSHVPEERCRIRDALSPEGFDCRLFDSPDALLAALVDGASGCIVVPADLPAAGVRGLIESLRRRELRLPVVVLGREDDLRVAVDLIRAGAAEFVEPPPNARRLRAAVRRALAAARVASHSRADSAS